MVKSYLRGHKVECLNDVWVYSDTKQPIVKTGCIYKERYCFNCKKEQTKEGHDGCLKTLMGVMNACCGHGINSDAYIQFLDGNSIHGEDAHLILEILKKN